MTSLKSCLIIHPWQKLPAESGPEQKEKYPKILPSSSKKQLLESYTVQLPRKIIAMISSDKAQFDYLALRNTGGFLPLAKLLQQSLIALQCTTCL